MPIFRCADYNELIMWNENRVEKFLRIRSQIENGFNKIKVDNLKSGSHKLNHNQIKVRPLSDIRKIRSKSNMDGSQIEAGTV